MNKNFKLNYFFKVKIGTSVYFLVFCILFNLGLRYMSFYFIDAYKYIYIDIKMYIDTCYIE